MRLLLVEDDPTISRFLLKGLREDQHVVDLAEDGPSGLDQAGAVDYDAVVLDLMLPGLDGFEVCRQMRGQHIAAPILIISARDAVRDRVRVLDCGADDYLVKPFAFEELLARLRALDRRGRNRQTARTHLVRPHYDRSGRPPRDARQSDVVSDRHRVPAARVSRPTRRINRHARSAGRVRLGRGLRSVFQRGGRLRRVRSSQIARGATPSADSHGARAWLHAEADLACAMTWRMRRMSFRAKLTVWWTLGFGLLLAVANLAIYGAFRSYLESDLDLKVRHGRRERTRVLDRRPRHSPARSASGSARGRRVHREVRADLGGRRTSAAGIGVFARPAAARIAGAGARRARRAATARFL